jgi:D-lactate dehydrogenase (cytochrome)
MSVSTAEAVERTSAEAKRTLFARLAARFGNRFSTGMALCEQHANTLTWIKCEPPDAVVFVETTPEVIEVVTLCAESRVPVIPFGTGTSLEGQVNAPFGGISLDLSRMNRVLAVHEEDLDCVVEPGVTRKALNDHLRDLGLFFPIDPGADASLGGMAATRASGANAVRYGTMRDNVLSLVAVMADGALLRTGNRARKSSSGYDLTRLLVGSEGTLGIITELTLRLASIPETILSAVCPFATIEGACNATIAAMQVGLPLARIELADEVQIRACNTYSHLTLGERPTLFLEFHGTAASTREQVGTFADIARGEGQGTSAGRSVPRSAPSSGRRATTPIGRRAACAQGPRSRRPMSACRSPRSPLALARRVPTLSGQACLLRSSAMWATGISTSCHYSMRAALKSPARCRGSTTGWSSARFAWTAPAPASMAWARVRFVISPRSTGPASR